MPIIYTIKPVVRVKREKKIVNHGRIIYRCFVKVIMTVKISV